MRSFLRHAGTARTCSGLLLCLALTVPALAAGKIEGPFEWRSEIFPGTVRNYWLYVPAEYDAAKPACVMIVQDGLNRAQEWKLPEALDALIAAGEVPVTIGVFVDPGVVPAANDNAQPRFNRSFEYDSLGDRYARFLIEELLPEVGKKYKLSDSPDNRLIAGASSGGICALNAAWERPDAFRRVLSTIGTYVGLRGGDGLATLVRKTEPKPLRIFLEDGKNDLKIYAGDWWLANEDMLAALEFAGYDVNHAWGDGGHDGRAAAEKMPEMLRWLWRDYPKPITAGQSKAAAASLLIDGEDWQLASDGHGFCEGPAVNDKGEVFFTDIPQSKIHKIDLDGKVTVFAEDTQKSNGLMFGEGGFLYACQNGNQSIVRYNADGRREVLFTDAPSNDLVVLAGTGYYTDPHNHKVWHVDSQFERKVVDEGINFPNGVITSPDQTMLYVADMNGRYVYSYQIQPDGSLAHKEPFGYLHQPGDQEQSLADGMTVDTEGRVYVATKIGLQVLDQLGRVNFIFNKPNNLWLSNAVFGGSKLDTLYVTCGGAIYKRRVNATGVRPWQAPVKTPKPGL